MLEHLFASPAHIDGGVRLDSQQNVGLEETKLEAAIQAAMERLRMAIERDV